MAARASLVVLLALAARGMAWEGLFAQSPFWYPEGWRRLAFFAVIFAIWTAITATRWRNRFPVWTFAAMCLLSCAGLGPAPVAAVLLFLVSSIAVGRILGASDTGIALLCGLGAYMCLAYGLAPWPVNHWLPWLALLVAPITVRPRDTWASIRDIAESAATHSWLGVAVSFVLTLHWIVAAKPDVSSDGLAMHLAIPAEVARLRYWPFDAGHIAWAVMPMGGDWCYTIVYLLGGEYAARLLNFALVPLVAALVYRAARHWIDHSGSLWTVLLYISSPMVHLVSGNLFVETFWAALPFGALLCLWKFEETGKPGDAIRTGWLLGCAAMVKLGALAFLAALAPFLGYAAWKRRLRGGWILPLGTGIPAAVPYLIAYWKTGNPVYPFLNASAAKPGIDFLYELTFRTSHWLESQNGAFGFQYLVLAPVAVFLVRREWGFREASAFGAAWVPAVLIALAQPNARYLYPAQAFLSILIAIVLARIPRARIVAGLCVALNLFFLPMSSYSNKIFAVNPFSRRDVDEFLLAGAPVRKLTNWLNEYRPGDPALFIGNPQIAGFRGRAYTDSWHHPGFLGQLTNANSDESLKALFAANGIGLFVAPVRGGGAFMSHVPLESFLERWTVPGTRNGPWRVAILATKPNDLPQPDPLQKGAHDDTDPAIRYRGAWRRDMQFAEAAHHTLIYSNDPGAAARFEFEGTAFTWIHTRAGNRGRAAISIDGGSPIEVDLHSAETKWRERLRFSVAPGQHAVEIRVLDSRYADIDAIEIE